MSFQYLLHIIQQTEKHKESVTLFQYFVVHSEFCSEQLNFLKTKIKKSASYQNFDKCQFL